MSTKTTSQTHKTMMIILTLIALLAAAGLAVSQAQPEPKKESKYLDPITATIIDVYTSQSGTWQTTVAWGDGERAVFNSKLGHVGEPIKLYPYRANPSSINLRPVEDDL